METIILSFTTFSNRANYIKPVINSIIHQTVKPDKIICVTELKITDFYPEIQKLLKIANIELIPAKQEDKGYKKLLPILKEYWGRDDVIIITIDDDWNYRKTLIHDLLVNHKKYPAAIICDRGRKIVKNRPYNAWPFNFGTMKHPHETLIMSGSGSLFKPTFFKESVFDLERIDLSPTADDIWWTIQAIIAGTPVLSLSARSHKGCGAVSIPNNVKLYSININQNVIQLNKLITYAQNKYNIDIWSKIYS